MENGKNISTNGRYCENNSVHVYLAFVLSNVVHNDEYYTPLAKPSSLAAVSVVM